MKHKAGSSTDVVDVQRIQCYVPFHDNIEYVQCFVDKIIHQKSLEDTSIPKVKKESLSTQSRVLPDQVNESSVGKQVDYTLESIDEVISEETEEISKNYMKRRSENKALSHMLCEALAIGSCKAKGPDENKCMTYAEVLVKVKELLQSATDSGIEFHGSCVKSTDHSTQLMQDLFTEWDERTKPAVVKHSEDDEDDIQHPVSDEMKRLIEAEKEYRRMYLKYIKYMDKFLVEFGTQLPTLRHAAIMDKFQPPRMSKESLANVQHDMCEANMNIVNLQEKRKRNYVKVGILAEMIISKKNQIAGKNATLNKVKEEARQINEVITDLQRSLLNRIREERKQTGNIDSTKLHDFQVVKNETEQLSMQVKNIKKHLQNINKLRVL
ncbi:hypothetical protein GJ496_004011 [Pomphorhynchus laevis]|nr:hypothetical protein GJ496_004011 [Pomphorhynchus laevis]